MSRKEAYLPRVEGSHSARIEGADEPTVVAQVRLMPGVLERPTTGGHEEPEEVDQGVQEHSPAHVLRPLGPRMSKRKGVEERRGAAAPLLANERTKAHECHEEGGKDGRHTQRGVAGDRERMNQGNGGRSAECKDREETTYVRRDLILPDTRCRPNAELSGERRLASEEDADRRRISPGDQP